VEPLFKIVWKYLHEESKKQNQAYRYGAQIGGCLGGNE